MKEIKAKFIGTNCAPLNYLYNFIPLDDEGKELLPKIITLILGSQQMNCFPEGLKDEMIVKLQWIKFNGYNGWVYGGIVS